MPATLSAKQAAFVAEYLKDGNGTQAAIRAGYSRRSAASQAERLLRKAEIRASVDARIEKAGVTSEFVLRELLRLSSTDISLAFGQDGALLPLKDIPEDVRRAISGVEIEELFEGKGEDRHQIGWTKKVKFWDKTRTLEMLGRHLKLFTDKVEHSFDGQTDEQLEARFRAITASTSVAAPLKESGE